MKTKTTTSPACSNIFCWSRFCDFVRYKYPQIRRQLILYPLLSLLFALLTFLPVPEVVQVGIFTLSWGIIPYLFYLAPIVFALGGDSRIVDRMVPASSFEKFIFYIVYTLIIIPILIYVLPYAADLIFLKIPSIQTEGMTGLVTLHTTLHSFWLTLLNLLSGTSVVLTCLFVILYCRSSRIVKAVVWVFVVQIFIGIAGIFYGASAFTKGFEDGKAGAAPADGDTLINSVLSELSQPTPFMIATISVLAIYICILIWQTYRTISKKDL